MDIKNQNIFSVSQINNQIKYYLEKNYSNIWIKAEISSYKLYPSGHAYLTLKDERSEVSAIIFSQYISKLNIIPNIGMDVLVLCDLSLYTYKGKFQIKIKNMYVAGEGELWLKYEKLKQLLQKEGFFDHSVKKHLPKYPQKIGIITSSNGAVIQDILNILNRRAPYIKCYIFPVPVQGSGASEKIVNAIDIANRHGLVEVIILARGGGSIEDLWSFNEEKLIRSIFNSSIPIVTGIGHETDNTLSDFVADYRAPTPSVAAEIIAVDKIEIIQRLSFLQDRLILNCQKNIKYFQHRIDLLASRLMLYKPKLIIDNFRQKLFKKQYLLELYMNSIIDRKITKIENISNKLHLLNPKNLLKRGYVIATDKNNKLICKLEDVKVNENIKLQLINGSITTKILKKESPDA